MSLKSFLPAFVMGFLWGIGIGCIAIGLSTYRVPLGILAPIYNMNTIITVLIALWLFSEWKQVQSAQLLLGTLLIVAGGVMVTRA